MDYMEFKQREDTKQAKEGYEAGLRAVVICNRGFIKGLGWKGFFLAPFFLLKVEGI